MSDSSLYLLTRANDAKNSKKILGLELLLVSRIKTLVQGDTEAYTYNSLDNRFLAGQIAGQSEAQ